MQQITPFRTRSKLELLLFCGQLANMCFVFYFWPHTLGWTCGHLFHGLIFRYWTKGAWHLNTAEEHQNHGSVVTVAMLSIHNTFFNNDNWTFWCNSDLQYVTGWTRKLIPTANDNTVANCQRVRCTHNTPLTSAWTPHLLTSFRSQRCKSSLLLPSCDLYIQSANCSKQGTRTGVVK